MSRKQEVFYIITYDISDRKRLQRVHRKVKEYAMNLQYSVFIAPFDQQLLQQMINELVILINLKKDDLRIYPISSTAAPVVIGNQMLPDGVYIDTPAKLSSTGVNRKCLMI